MECYFKYLGNISSPNPFYLGYRENFTINPNASMNIGPIYFYSRVPGTFNTTVILKNNMTVIETA